MRVAFAAAPTYIILIFISFGNFASNKPLTQNDLDYYDLEAIEPIPYKSKYI